MRPGAAARHLRSDAGELGSLRGVYTKLGQQLAIRADALSDEFRAPFATLAESAPPVPFERIRAELERAFRTTERFA